MLCSVHEETGKEAPPEVITALTGHQGQPQPQTEVPQLLAHLHHRRHAAGVDEVVMAPLLPMVRRRVKMNEGMSGM